jgi:hypothetical protein
MRCQNPAAVVGALSLMRLLNTAHYKQRMFFEAHAPSDEYDVRGRRWMDCIVRLGNGRAIGRARVNVFVIRAFVKMRETLLSTRELAKKLAALEKKLTSRLDVHEAAIVELLQELMQILSPPPPPPEPSRKQIGFHP